MKTVSAEGCMRERSRASHSLRDSMNMPDWTLPIFLPASEISPRIPRSSSNKTLTSDEGRIGLTIKPLDSILESERCARRMWLRYFSRKPVSKGGSSSRMSVSRSVRFGIVERSGTQGLWLAGPSSTLSRLTVFSIAIVSSWPSLMPRVSTSAGMSRPCILNTRKGSLSIS